MNPTPDILQTYNPDDAAQNLYHDLINSIEDYAILLLSPVGQVLTWNTGAGCITQYQANEITGKSFSVFYTSDDKAVDLPAKVLVEAVARGKYEDEGWRVKKDGSVFWATHTITPVYDQEKKHTGFSLVIKDLSEKKKAEADLYIAFEELKESEQKFRLMVEGVTDYTIIMLNASGNVATWNEGARRMKGYEADEILGKYFSKFYSPESVQKGFPEYELKQARLLGRFEDNGWRYRKDGSAFWANTVLTAIYNAKKQLIGYSKITRDLTEKLKMEQQLFQVHEELKDSEEKNRLLVNSVKDYAILMLDPEGRIMSWNTGAERIKGYKANEITGKHFSVFYPRPAIEQGFPQYELKKALEVGRFEDEGWRIRKDGTAFWANVVLTPIYSSKD